MKPSLHIIILLLLFPGITHAQVKIPGFQNHLTSKQKIKDIHVTNRTDSLSFALGVAWATNLENYGGYNKISPAFYVGVNCYLGKDSSFMNLKKANSYANHNLQAVRKSKNWPKDTNIRLCDIHLKNKFDTFSYALGYTWARGAYGAGLTNISPALIKGMVNRLQGDTSIFPDYASATGYLQKYVEELRLSKFKFIKAKNETWLKQNAQKPGVITFPDGMEYKVLKHGHGSKVNIGEHDILETYYTSKLINGTVYETYTTKPYEVYVFALLKGLKEAVKQMKTGDKWEIYLPYNLAYGSGGVNNAVPPFATVIVDLEILKVSKK